MRVLLGLLALTFGAAPEDAVRLRWTAPDDCSSGAEVEARMWHLLEGSTEVGVTSVEADAEVSVRDGTWSLRLSVRRGAEVGTRRLQAGSCDELAQATALIVAMTVDPKAAAENEPTVEPPSAEPTPPADASPLPTAELAPPVPESAPALAPAPPTDRPPAPSPRRSMPSMVLRLGGGAGLGLLPRLGANVLAGIGARGRRWMIELEGTLWTPRVGEVADVRGRFTLWHLGVRGCPVFTVGRFELPVCGGVAAGAMHGRGDRGVSATRAIAPWVGVDLGGRALFVPTRFFATGIDARALFSLTRPAFDTAQGRLVHETSVAGGQFAWIVEFRPFRPR